MSKALICTASGKSFDLLAPTVDMVDIGDIAAALSKICRFTGHCAEFYSVAQHSVLVCDLLRNTTPEVRAWGLLHDAAEAYVGDVASPLKRCLPAHEAIEARVRDCIQAKFGLVPYRTVKDAVGVADRLALAIEARDLMGDPDNWPGLMRERAASHPLIQTWHPQAAHDWFIDRFAAFVLRPA